MPALQFAIFLHAVYENNSVEESVDSDDLFENVAHYFFYSCIK